MEIKIPKEVNDYKENIFFGLSTRQFIFSLLAVIAAAAIYIFGKEYLGAETASWLCILAAAPLAAMGFFRYNGMNAEQFIWAVIKSEVLFSGHRLFHAENIYRYATARKGEKEID